MRRLHLVVCLSVMVALGHVSLAGACINDRETVRTESEFKKHYEFKSGFQGQERPPESTGSKNGWVPLTAAFSGAGLLACSAALITVNVRRVRRS